MEVIDNNEYKLEVTSEDRAGNIIYIEPAGKLTFRWEFSTNGAIINIPANKLWFVRDG